MPLLFLLRHAKSSWKEEGLADHDRPLAPRGRRAAKAIGEYLREHAIEPELVLCSTATRAHATLDRLELAHGPRIALEPELYAAGAATLLARLTTIPPDVRSAMLIGHNPGIHELTRVLAGRAPGKFPTAALATLACPAWAALAPGTAELTAFVRPREL
jgi:phosphohistidine phosphatase